MKIIKVKFGQYEQTKALPGFVYVGREYGDYPASRLGNPFKVSKEDSLKTVLMLYEQWLGEQLDQMPGWKDWFMKVIGPESVLGCWCVNNDNPLETPWDEVRCHAEVVAKTFLSLSKP